MTGGGFLAGLIFCTVPGLELGLLWGSVATVQSHGGIVKIDFSSLVV